MVALGATDARERSTGVTFSAELEVAYRACLWSRVANRVFLELARFDAVDADGFYTAVREIDWTEHLGPEATLACDFSGQHPAITHTHFGALKLKDAIVDSVRDSRAWRPSVELERPSVRVHAHAHGNSFVVSLDLSGESLHRRGYRGAAGEAPLKENVAAGVLLRSGWGDLAAGTTEFLDPMCGSGTFVIEAALIASDRAPGLDREYFGFLGWAGHNVDAWERLLVEARARARAGMDAAVARGLEGAIRGRDRDSGAVRNARGNAERAGVQRLVRFDVGVLADAAPMERVRVKGASAEDAEGGLSLPAAGDLARATETRPMRSTEEAAIEPPMAASLAPAAAGLLCTNPPYGVRLDDRDTARAVHRELGVVLRERFQGWNAAVLTGTPEFGLELGIRAHRTHTVWNGAIECRLLRMKVDTGSAREPGRLGKGDTNLRDTPGAQMFANRLAKNLKKQQAWADRSGVSCYRLYDADMPEYAFAIDVYRTIGEAQGEPASNTADARGVGRAGSVAGGSPGAGELTWLYVQEYAAPAEIELESVRKRRGEALSTLADVTGVAQERVRVRTRRKNKRGEQYSKVQDRDNYYVVMEDGLKFLVNFDDYLDTGLFLDHRTTRGRLRAAASGKRFLNLFAYTCTATVYAAAGGAVSTTSVDMSNTYLNWAQRNFELNGLSPDRNGLVQADCRVWLQEANRSRERYDLIFIDPPTFSNSKRMEGVFDVERDHPEFIDGCVRLLAPGGLIVFSTNSQRFRLDESLSQRYDVRDISAGTLPKDFERNPRIHRCFEVRVG
ncbi:MAG TPA: bifunctional 23S rRNA (guanine(2069)-N(7))-methyltransferase RlmK/23S rRNA (guanine(2445)-N(2))-methyltransferase RlmL [Steroidobacteraceae bacterium]|nr:bifunctional 23S rRNA (guanine(2069)-N(7))-methyltransferase RlmK/23S rRNA (guanine(2445)-N(2))-methyltransferase RlmL [Steroidobacteraceae bacterium]